MNRPLTYTLLLLLLCSLLAGCTGVSSCPVPAAEREQSVNIYIIRHRWHTGIILPADSLQPELAFIKEDLPDAEYYEFGWGDAAFYQDPQERISVALRAALWPTDSVMHVVALPRSPARFPHTDLQSIPVDAATVEKIGRELVTHFAYRNEPPEPLGRGLYGDSLFYPAQGTFWLGRNCNTWTASVLKEANLATAGISPRLTAGSVMRMSRAIAEECG